MKYKYHCQYVFLLTAMDSRSASNNRTH